MVDKFRDPLLTPAEAARHLGMPASTLYYWLGEEVDGAPVIHRVSAARRGWPSMPFIAVVEAYVLRAMRDLGLRKDRILAAVAEARREFKTPYALATERVRTDGVDLFLHYADGELVRFGDGQRPIREVLDLYLRDISFNERDGWPERLRLRRYGEAEVVIDPRFSWGAPVIQPVAAPVDAVVTLWKAGEPMEVVADEFGLTRDVVEAVCRVAA